MGRAPVLVCVVVLSGLAGAGVAGAQSVSISLAIAEESVAEGDRVVVDADSPVQIQVTADRELDSVVLRVNGETRETYSPGTSSFSETVTPDLDTGTNEIRVIATDVDGAIEDVTVTVLKDNRRPVVTFESPFRSDESGPPESHQVDGAYVTLAGEIHDHTGVERIEIVRRFVYTFAGKERMEPETYRIRNPGGSFSQEVFLGTGSNEVEIVLDDRLGNQRTYVVTLTVVDGEAPSIDVATPPDRTPAPEIRLEGEVTDNGQLDAVLVEISGGTVSILNPVGPKPDPTRSGLVLDDSVKLKPGRNTIEVVARDLAGNEERRRFGVTYEKTVAPLIRINAEQTTIAEDGTLALRGDVTYGEITAVSVETMNAETDEAVGFVQVYEGPRERETVAISENLPLADEAPTRVVVRATDSNGEEHLEEFTADATTGTLSLGRDEARNDGESGAAGAESGGGSGDGSSDDGANAGDGEADDANRDGSGGDEEVIVVGEDGTGGGDGTGANDGGDGSDPEADTGEDRAEASGFDPSWVAQAIAALVILLAIGYTVSRS